MDETAPDAKAAPAAPIDGDVDAAAVADAEETGSVPLVHAPPLPLCCGADSRLRRCVLALVENDVFEYFVLMLIIASSAVLVLDTPRLDLQPSSTLAVRVDIANVAFTAVFTLEALLKVYG